MDRYVVFDLEMCPVPKGEKRTVFGHFSELIEIGAVLLNDSFEIIDRFKTYVKPEYGVITPYIQKLTRISKADVLTAPTAEEALSMFVDWIPQGAVLVSWSDNDEHQLRMEIAGKRIEHSRLEALLDNIVDCQPMFSEKLDSPKKYRLTEALSIADIDYDEAIHDALSDASNTALLFAKMQREETLSLNPYYGTEDSTKGTFSPFAALLANYANAG